MLYTKVELITINRETFPVWRSEEPKLPEFGGSVPPLQLPERPIINTSITFEPMIGAVFVGFKPIVRSELVPLPCLEHDGVTQATKESHDKEGIKLIKDIPLHINLESQLTPA